MIYKGFSVFERECFSGEKLSFSGFHFLCAFGGERGEKRKEEIVNRYMLARALAVG